MYGVQPKYLWIARQHFIAQNNHFKDFEMFISN